MEIRFKCDACGQPVSVSDDLIGQTFACPNPACGRPLAAPAEAAPAEPKPAARAAPVWTPPPPPPPVPRRPPPAPPPAPPAKAAELPKPAAARPVTQAPAAAPRTSPAPLPPPAGVSPKMASGPAPVSAGGVREAATRVMKGVISIAALLLLQVIVGAVLKERGSPGEMTLTDWVRIGVSLAVAVCAMGLYWPVKTIVTFYLAASVKARKGPEGERYRGKLVAAAGNVTLLVFVVAIYASLLPTVSQCSAMFASGGILAKALHALVFLGVIGILFALWRNVQPWVDHVTGRITDKVSTLSSDLAYVHCPACQAKNVRDTAFCVACGGALKQKEAAAAGKNSCPQCSLENMPGAKFCRQCGTPL